MLVIGPDKAAREPRSGKLRIGIDVGGTFTDFLVMEAGAANRIHKVLSTPDDPSMAVIDGLTELAGERGQGLPGSSAVEMIVHGTTVTTNAVLTGKTARTGLLTTRGFRDALEMRRGVRERLYDNKYMRAEAAGAAHAAAAGDREGQCRRPAIVSSSIWMMSMPRPPVLRRDKVEAVAICFMHSYANQANEERRCAGCGNCFAGAYYSVSSRVLPQVRFYRAGEHHGAQCRHRTGPQPLPR